MNDCGFKEGKLDYTIATGVTPARLAELATGKWDGFIAFANVEKRLDQLSGITLDEQFLAERVGGLDSVEGYVTELNLWRQNGGLLEELAAEREEDTYALQLWLLDTSPASGTGNCWHRESATKAGSHHKDGNRLYSGDLASVEVVWPEKRLNFFITRGK